MANEREPGVDRIIAFSDGVVAIAITLLILPLTEIDRTREASLSDVIVDNQTALFAFALSFAVIANYWTIHDSILQPLRRHNRRLIQLNMVWLALIVFLPFPTALIADGLDGGFATLYIGALLAISFLNLLLLNYLTHHPELTDGEAAAENRSHITASWFNIATLVLALVISLFSAKAGIWALLLLIPAQMVAGRLSNRAAGVPPTET
jgi:uncharacterized membrane protein